MIARIRKGLEKKDQGFTLIELLVVMIIIGILAAVAIPIFMSQREKAQDTAAKADVGTLGKEIASYYVDGTVLPTLAVVNGRYILNGRDVGGVSANVTVIPQGAVNIAGNDATDWCVAVENLQGTVQRWEFSAQGGLVAGSC